MITLNEEAGLSPCCRHPWWKVKGHTPTHTHTQSTSSKLFWWGHFSPHNHAKYPPIIFASSPPIAPKDTACGSLQSQTPDGCQTPLAEPRQRWGKRSPKKQACGEQDTLVWLPLLPTALNAEPLWALVAEKAICHYSCPMPSSKLKVNLKMEVRDLSYLWFPYITIILIPKEFFTSHMQFQSEGRKLPNRRDLFIAHQGFNKIVLSSRRTDTYKYALNDQQLGHSLELRETWEWRCTKSLKT